MQLFGILNVNLWHLKRQDFSYVLQLILGILKDVNLEELQLMILFK